MRNNLDLNQYRIRRGELSSPDSYGMAGAFLIPIGLKRRAVVVSCNGDIGTGWEHVSVHIISGKKKHQETPTWNDMCYIKNMFWSDDEIAIQIHPKKTDYINVHNHTLHLWRSLNQELLTPPNLLV